MAPLSSMAISKFFVVFSTIRLRSMLFERLGLAAAHPNIGKQVFQQFPHLVGAVENGLHRRGCLFRESGGTIPKPPGGYPVNRF